MLLKVQCSPFIAHLIGYKTIMMWLPIFFQRILQRNYRKMTIKWSFSYYSFVKLSLYNMIHL